MDRSRRLITVWVVCACILASPLAQSQTTDIALNLPNAPSTDSGPNTPQAASVSPTGGNGTSENSSAQSSTDTKNSPADKPPVTAEQQLKLQEKQRILGVMATFNTTQNKSALPLSPSQKFQLFFKSVTDPWPFALTAFVAGIDQAEDSFPEYGQGMQGYAKRYGASYADYVTGNFFGNAVLPSLLHEDPRYFQKSTGSVLSRVVWAAGSTVWSKRDNGNWGPNYANVVGNLTGSAISNAYYPEPDRTVRGTFERGITVTLEGAVGAELIEFWPDVVRHYKQKKAKDLAHRSANRG